MFDKKFFHAGWCCARRVVLLLLAALVLAASPSGVLALFTEDIKTEGEIPTDLNGVWLMVNTLEFKNDRSLTLPHLYRITHVPMKIAQILRSTPRPTPAATEEEGRIIIPRIPGRRLMGDDIDVMFLEVEFPESIASVVEEHRVDSKRWTPTQEDLQILGEKWSTLKPVELSEYSRIEYRIVAAENFDQSLEIDDSTKGSKFAIIANQTLVPGPKTTAGNIVFVYGVREIEPGQLRGTFVRSMLAGAPFPVAVTSNGKFVMYKIAELESEKAAEQGTATPEAPKASPSPAGVK